MTYRRQTPARSSQSNNISLGSVDSLQKTSYNKLVKFHDAGISRDDMTDIADQYGQKMARIAL